MPNHVFFENDALILKSRVLQLKGKNIVAALSKNQTLLVFCLANKLNDRKMVSNFIWPGEDAASIENRYYQLVFSTRRALKKNGFPSDFILTLQGFGACLHQNYFGRVTKYSPLSLHHNVETLI